MPLFPSKAMTRVSSGGIPGTRNNDVLFIYIEIESDVLYLRVGFKEKISEGRFPISGLKRKDGVATTVFQVEWSVFSGKYIQACEVEVSYANVSDGQMILGQAGTETVYNTLNSSPPNNTEKFTWRDGEVSAILLHAYCPGATRWHDVIRVRKSRVIVLRVRRCWINVDKDKKRSSMAGPLTAELSVLDLMGARFAGYTAYSWSSSNSLFAFTKEKLVDAKIRYDHSDSSSV
ncbi:hypothetical protein F4782DRAFT_548451 [Xylaria castorea]|nr:hypothetical protein F4782DRAFT_548451 [Xylaria castorea]